MFKMAVGSEEDWAKVKTQLKEMAKKQPTQYSCTFPRGGDQDVIEAPWPDGGGFVNAQMSPAARVIAANMIQTASYPPSCLREFT